MYSAELIKIVEAFQLVNILPEISLKGRVVKRKEVNRPALQLGGFYESFDNDRIQVIGRVEHNFLLSLEEEKRKKLKLNLPPKAAVLQAGEERPQAIRVQLLPKHHQDLLKRSNSAIR